MDATMHLIARSVQLAVRQPSGSAGDVGLVTFCVQPGVRGLGGAPLTRLVGLP